MRGCYRLRRSASSLRWRENSKTDADRSSPGDTIVTYCLVGYRASMTYFAARALGLPVKIYDGSYQDWARRGLPVVKGTTP